MDVSDINVRPTSMHSRQELQEFTERWLGRRLRADDGVSVSRSLNIPTALRDIYETFGSVQMLTTPHNRLRPPDAICVSDGYRIFYDENQEVVSWAFLETDASEANPMVYQGTTMRDGYEWHSEEMR